MTPLIKYNEQSLDIVLVEDDDGDAKALKRAFERAGISNRIVRAIDGLDALELLRGENDRDKITSPFLLLADVNMPRMNGIELVRSIRADEALRRSIVFILTTSNRDEDKAAAYEQNVAGYISKAKAAEDFLNLITLIRDYALIVEFP